jgi:cytochrome o ubiquinol oxidase subunit 2
VVALNWKWLFVYPDQDIASVNLAEIPVGTPIDFYVTSDTVMNSFWVPQLGGQIYAMPGMSTQLHLVAGKTGDYFGSPANIAGSGFAHMNFTVRAVSSHEFTTWAQAAQNTSHALDALSYEHLARPSQDVPVGYYSPVASDLYNKIITHYMAPSGMEGM